MKWRGVHGDQRRFAPVQQPLEESLRANRPPLLAIWGKHDPTFVPAGAEVFRRDVPDADRETADAMLAFLGNYLKAK